MHFVFSPLDATKSNTPDSQSGSAVLRTDSSQIRLVCQKANKETASFFILLTTS